MSDRIADYFCLLGSGDSLIPQHNNNNTLDNNNNNKDDDDIHVNNKNDNHNFLMEECALIERFYREIVDVGLVVATNKSTDDSIQQQTDLNDGQTVYTGCPLYQNYFISFRRRGADESDRPALADIALFYCIIDLTGVQMNLNDPNTSLNNKNYLNDSYIDSSYNGSLNQDDSIYNNDNNQELGVEVSLNQSSTSHTTTKFKLNFNKLTNIKNINNKLGHINNKLKNNLQNKLNYSKYGDDEHDDDDDDDLINYHNRNNNTTSFHHNINCFESILLKDCLSIPSHYDEIVIPQQYNESVLTLYDYNQNDFHAGNFMKSNNNNMMDRHPSPRRHNNYTLNFLKDSNGVEAIIHQRSPSNINVSDRSFHNNSNNSSRKSPNQSFYNHNNNMNTSNNTNQYAKYVSIVNHLPPNHRNSNNTLIIPCLALRRQVVGFEQRFYEDPGIVDVSVRKISQIVRDLDDEEEGEESVLLTKSPWVEGGRCTPYRNPASLDVNYGTNEQDHLMKQQHSVGSHDGSNTFVIMIRRNQPQGLCDMSFYSSVLSRFPSSNYPGLPLPMEELPLFCYPNGCKLFRSAYTSAPLPESYGFVLKNERGDNLYISCLSFYEVLNRSKVKQLESMSEQRRRTSLSCRFYCEQKDHHFECNSTYDTNSFGENHLIPFDDIDLVNNGVVDDDDCLVGFDDLITFEHKVLCVISRYPYWTVFRRFLADVNLAASTTSELPIERLISHFILNVQLPAAGGAKVLVPLHNLNSQLVLINPPAKDLPLLDLPFQRLFSALDVRTVVLIVIGFLSLERKLILISSHASLLQDVCELLRSLLFPFDVMCPYVPRLVPAFIHSLEFPGATFVGIHDDLTPDNLASKVRREIPEEAVVVEIDTGEIQCSGDSESVIRQTWTLIPSGPKAALISEIEALCRDANVVPGQEPLDSQVDPAFNVSVATQSMIEDFHQTGKVSGDALDNRSVRDAFLRFFCLILGGYEQWLVVPDIDYHLSGNEWFNTSSFVGTAPAEYAPYLGSLVNTQLFQSFIQRRTEASDFQCVLFDECLKEYHSSPAPYGRLGADAELPQGGPDASPGIFYSLLVDQCATELKQIRRGYGDYFVNTDSDYPSFQINHSNSFAESSISASFVGQNNRTLHVDTGFGKNAFGLYAGAASSAPNEIVYAPSREGLLPGLVYNYCSDGNPVFPSKLDSSLFLPSSPELVSTKHTVNNIAILTRSEEEVEESSRRRKVMTSSQQGLHKKRRCLWQLPKLMASHVLGVWLMCIPIQVEEHEAHSDKELFLLRALGALKTLRRKHKIIPDEAAYRSLMVACTRVPSDRRIEIGKLFGCLRADDIHPSAVTLGQYTKAIAEGYSKHISNGPSRNEIATDNNEVVNNKCISWQIGDLDPSLHLLEEAGRAWQKDKVNNDTDLDASNIQSKPTVDEVSQNEKKINTKKSQSSWLPVQVSSSFHGADMSEDSIEENQFRFVIMWSKASSCETCDYVPLDEEIQAGWDMPSSNQEVPGGIICPRCGHLTIPMLGYKNMTINEALTEGAVNNLSVPSPPNTLSAFRAGSDKRKSNAYPDPDWSLSNTTSFDTTSTTISQKKIKQAHYVLGKQHLPSDSTGSQNDQGVIESLPTQIVHRGKYNIDDFELKRHLESGDSFDNNSDTDSMGFVTYMDPEGLRLALERYLQDHGEDYLDRETLCKLDPRLFYNLWWFSARFNLPLPLPVKKNSIVDDDDPNLSSFSPIKSKKRKNNILNAPHWISFIAWDQSVAERGARSAANVVRSLLASRTTTQGDKLCKLARATSGVPLLAKFNLQQYTQADWDHALLSKLLVSLVEACDKRDFRPLVDIVLQFNRKLRIEQQGMNSNSQEGSVRETNSRSTVTYDDYNSSDLFTPSSNNMNEVNCYRTLLYLVRYQCTSAFHRFFPTTNRACRGLYHFWCINGSPSSTFDQLYHRACNSLHQDMIHHNESLRGISDVAIAFRSMFGHVI